MGDCYFSKKGMCTINDYSKGVSDYFSCDGSGCRFDDSLVTDVLKSAITRSMEEYGLLLRQAKVENGRE